MIGGGGPVAENAWVLGDIRIRASHVGLALFLPLATLGFILKHQTCMDPFYYAEKLTLTLAGRKEGCAEIYPYLG